jgi:hypothetical protein
MGTLFLEFILRSSPNHSYILDCTQDPILAVGKREERWRETRKRENIVTWAPHPYFRLIIDV